MSNPNRRPLSPHEIESVRLGNQSRGRATAPVGATVGVSEDGQPLDFRQAGFWAKLTADRTDNLYGWSEVYPLLDGSVVEETASPETRYGTDEVWPAVEVEGATGVAEGAIVWLVPGQGAYFVFSAMNASGGITRSVVDRVTCDSLGNLVNRYTIAYGPPLPTPPTGSNVIEGNVTVDAVAASGREIVLTYGGFEWRATTDGSGDYTVSDLPGGTYVVMVVPEAGEAGTIHQSVTVPTSPQTADFTLTT